MPSEGTEVSGASGVGAADDGRSADAWGDDGFELAMAPAASGWRWSRPRLPADVAEPLMPIDSRKPRFSVMSSTFTSRLKADPAKCAAPRSSRWLTPACPRPLNQMISGTTLSTAET